VQQLTHELETAEKQLQVKTKEFEALQVFVHCGCRTLLIMWMKCVLFASVYSYAFVVEAELE